MRVRSAMPLPALREAPCEYDGLVIVLRNADFGISRLLVRALLPLKNAESDIAKRKTMSPTASLKQIPCWHTIIVTKEPT